MQIGRSKEVYSKIGSGKEGRIAVTEINELNAILKKIQTVGLDTRDLYCRTPGVNSRSTW
jgi:hypothetical protein